jgi:type 1 glutamine amidotransferase/glucose/arabinose dehydrogenase
VWKGHNNLSRFVLKTDGTLDLASEKVLLEVADDRGGCCHVGGDIDFDAAGNLYMTTGDNSNAWESNGYAPLDERLTRNPRVDAQRSSGNTNDLRGKVLRIKPQPNGTYTIPPGNLFPSGTARTRPEIYAMGFRNPFRMSVDRPTGIVYLGDMGPDAGGTNSSRGPSGQVEFNRITSAGNYGWPYCTGANTEAERYNAFTFPSGPSGPKYDCANGPTNNSPRNTGLLTLPPARPAWIRYSGDAGSPPEFGSGSESPMGGEVYRFDPSLNSPIKFPQSLNGRFFAAEYGRRWIKAIEVRGDGSPGVIESFPWAGTQIIDTDFGPDGALYVLQYGTNSGDQALYRIEYIGGGNRSPIAMASANRTSGGIPLTIVFSSSGSSDPEGGALSYFWSFGDGVTSMNPNPTHTYASAGTYHPTLTVTDPVGATGSASLVVTAGNSAPTVVLQTPIQGQIFAYGASVPFTISISDPEDGAINCSRARLTYAVGHDSHAHDVTSRTGCSGSLLVPADGEHEAGANLYGVFRAEYTDNGGLTTQDVHTLQPARRQAEHFSAQSGIQIAPHPPAEGASAVGFTENGDWISFTPYALGNATKITARVASGGAGGTLEVRAGSPTGTLLGSVAVSPTGGWESYTNVSANLSSGPAGSTTLYLVFKGAAGQALFDLDAFTFDTSSTPGPGPDRVLVFSKTAGFRHDSIPSGIAAVQALGTANGFSVTATEDSTAFTAANLAQYKAVIFLSTTGDVLNAAQQSAMQSYVDGGGGFVGVHAAADTEYDWPYYEQLVGALFESHPATQQATLRNEDRTHPATQHLAATWTRTDEWYNFRTNPRPRVRVLQNLDEGSYGGGNMGDHPITWCHVQGQGRSFYTGLGHTTETYAEPAFRTLLLGAIRYATGAAPGNCSPAGGGDTQNPTTVITSPAGGATVSGTITVSASASDNVGVSRVEFLVDGSLAATDNSAPYNFSWNTTALANGSHRLRSRAFDAANNAGTGTEITVTVSNGGGGIVQLFQHCNFGGWAASFGAAGNYSRAQIVSAGGLDNDASSLKVASGFKVTLFDGDAQTGTSIVLTADSPCFVAQGFNDQLSSMRIESVGGTPAITVEAEAFTTGSGVQAADHGPASGGRTLGYIESGDWAGYASVSTVGARSFSARVSSDGAGGTIQVRSGSSTGTVLGTVAVAPTGGWETFATVSTTLNGSGAGPLFLTFTGGGGALFDVDTVTIDD